MPYSQGTRGRRILVTGASGFVGRAVLDALSGRDLSIVAVSRRPRSEPSVNSKVDWLQADLADTAGWDRALEGADTVVHVAGNPGTGTDADMMNVNCDWTAMLARRSVGSGVARFVHVSTVRVYGHQPEIGAETAPDPADAYGRSKLAAEEALFAEASGRMAASVVRPPFVFGADRTGLLSVMAVAAQYRVPLPLGALRNRRSLINVRNLGELLARAALEGPARGNFRLPAAEGFDPTYGELFALFGQALGRRVRTFPAPDRLLQTAARALWTKETAHRLFDNCVVDGSILARRIDWTPKVAPAEALRSILVFH